MVRFITSMQLLFLDGMFIPNVDRLAGNERLSKLLNLLFVVPTRQRLASRISLSVLVTSVTLVLCLAGFLIVNSSSMTDGISELGRLRPSWTLSSLVSMRVCLLFAGIYVAFIIFELILPSFPTCESLRRFVAGESRSNDQNVESWLYNLFRFVPLTAEQLDVRKKIVRDYIDESRDQDFNVEADQERADFRALNIAIAMKVENSYEAKDKRSYDPTVGRTVAGRTSFARTLMSVLAIIISYLLCVTAIEFSM